LDFLRESQGSFGLLLGPGGSGKSTVLVEFGERAERSGAFVALVSAATSDEQALLSPLAIGLQADPEGEAAQLWRRIADRLQEISLESLSAVILLDDLDRATAPILSLVERLLATSGAPLTVVASA